MAGFASAVIAAVVLGLASNTDGAITTVQLHRKNAKLDRVASRSDRNVVCAPHQRPCAGSDGAESVLSAASIPEMDRGSIERRMSCFPGRVFGSCGFIVVIVVAPGHSC